MIRTFWEPGVYYPPSKTGGSPLFVTIGGEVGMTDLWLPPGHGLESRPIIPGGYPYYPKTPTAPPTPTTVPDPSPTYDQPVQAVEPNLPKAGKAIPEHFGRLKIYPDLAAAERVDGDTVTRLYCIGRGEYDVETVLIDDVDAASLPDVEATVGLSTDTALAAKWPTYVADNRHAFAPVDLTAAMSAAIQPGVKNTTEVTFYLYFPDGLYQIDADGGYQAATVGFQIQYRAAGSADSWQILAAAHTITSMLVETRSAQITLTTPDGLWEFRIARTSDPSTDPRVRDRAQLTGARVVGYGSLAGYGDVTLLTVRAPGGIGKVACIATRKLPVWNGTAWTAPQATRSIPWAVAEIVRTVTGSDAMLDLPALQSMDAALAARGDYFDGRFDNKLSAMEAIANIAAAGRCQAFVQWGWLRLVRDEAVSGFAAMFTPLNMLEKSWRLRRRPKKPSDPDHYVVEYLDSQDWTVKEVVCDLGARNIPETIKLFGVTSKLQAWREGMHLLRSARYRRKTISFTAGLEARALLPLDRILVGHDVYGFIHFGELYAIEGMTLVLSNPVNFYGQAQADIYLRQPDGSPIGPLAVTPGSTDYQVTLVDPLPAGTYCTVLGDQHPQRTHYLFDPLGKGAVAARVIHIAERSADEIEVTAVIDDDQAYQETDPAWDQASPTYDPNHPSSVDPVTQVSPPPGAESAYLRNGRLTFNPNLYNQGAWTVSFEANGYDLFEVQVLVAATGQWKTMATIRDTSYTFFVSGMDQSAGVRIVPWLGNTRLESEAWVIPPTDYDPGPAAVAPVKPPYVIMR